MSSETRNQETNGMRKYTSKTTADSLVRERFPVSVIEGLVREESLWG